MMSSRSAALRSGILAARTSRSIGISQQYMGARHYATEPSEGEPAARETTEKETAEKVPADVGIPNKNKGNTTYIIAGAFGVTIAGTIAFLMGNPRKAQELGGQYHPQAQSKEDKFKRAHTQHIGSGSPTTTSNDK